MTHLPECVDAMIPDFHNERWVCICAPLRACEQRVTERWESLHGWGESYAYKTGSDNGFDVGYAAGLDRAREAVDSLHLRLNSGEILRQSGDWENALDKALRAIDALRGDP